jgi:hypothetical protein
MTKEDRDLPVHQRVLQHPPPSLISGWHQPAGVRSKGGIMRSVTGTKPLQVQQDPVIYGGVGTLRLCIPVINNAAWMG